MAALLFLLASCQKSETNRGDSGDVIRFTASVGTGNAFTRTNPIDADAAKRASFNEGDVVSLLLVNEGNNLTVSNYTYTSGEWLADNAILWSSDEMYLKFGYPQLEFDEFGQPAQNVLVLDQSSIDKIAKADAMNDIRFFTKPADGEALDLVFHRANARVVVKIKAFSDEFTDAENMKVENLKIYAQYDDSDSDDQIGHAVSPYTEHDGGVGSVYYALVPHIALNTTNEKIISLEVDGKEYVVNGSPEWESGKSYTYNLTIGKLGVTLSSVVVSDWSSGAIIGGHLI